MIRNIALHIVTYLLKNEMCRKPHNEVVSTTLLAILSAINMFITD